MSANEIESGIRAGERKGIDGPERGRRVSGCSGLGAEGGG